MNYPIFIASSPNTQADDFFLAIRKLVSFWNWNGNKDIIKLETELQKYVGIKNAILTDSARSALFLILKTLDLKPTDEVILPSFTCLVVANAAHYTGAKLRFVDTSKEDFNFDLSDLETKINKNTKAILIQHTFGKKIDIKKIKAMIAKYDQKIMLIEDWAHSLKRNEKLEGDAAILTFGIEKLISGVRLGAVVTNDDKLSYELRESIAALPNFPLKKNIVSILNPIFWYIANPLHVVGIGKYSIGAVVRGLWRKLGFLGIMIEKDEHQALNPGWFPCKPSNALASLTRNQLRKLDKFNEQRSQIAKIYHKKLSEISDEKDFDDNRVYLRYPILLKNQELRMKVWNTAKNQRITLGDWYVKPLYSKYVNEKAYKTLGYDPKETPVTVDKCTRVLNLPTGVIISEKRAESLVKLIVL